MKYLFLIVALASFISGDPAASAQADGQAATSAAAPSQQPLNAEELAGARKARALVDQAIQALGGDAYLNIRDVQQEGRTYSFHHGQPTSNGVLFWRFVEYPDKERIELTKQRDVAYTYSGDKGYEITYKGPHPVEKKDLDEYLRRRKFSLDTILRTWINDPGVAFFFNGNALAGNLPAQQITLINARNEAISLFFDVESHLPLKKTYTWRDPVDREKNVEEEIFDNYRLVQGVMTPYGFTRYFNGDMQNERFVNTIHFNQGLNKAMFDPDSHYDPNKQAGKH